MKRVKTLFIVVVLVGFAWLANASWADPHEALVPLKGSHAHNDYWHNRPLFDALDQGFTSVEADVFYEQGQFLVGHDRSELKSERTLETLYLKPLQGYIKAHDNRIFVDGSGLMLLVDMKTDGTEAYPPLDSLLTRYADMLTGWVDGKVVTGPVTVVISGNRPWKRMIEDRSRYVGVDGRLSDLASDLSSSLLPLISDRWISHFTWNGRGAMPASERDKLETILAKAHAKHRRVRFWATPDQPGPQRDAVWKVLLDAGVDLINTDDLQGLNHFFKK